MGKPPSAPPNSDIDGVNEDRKPIDHPDNARAKVRGEAEARRKDSIGKPSVGSVTTGKG